MTERRLLHVPQAAVYANVGVAFIRSLITKQRLRAIDLGRYYLIDREDLDACLQELKSKPIAPPEI